MYNFKKIVFNDIDKELEQQILKEGLSKVSFWSVFTVIINRHLQYKQSNHKLTTPIQISNSNFKKKYSKYRKCLDLLKINNIIYINESYSVDLQFSKRYALHYDFVKRRLSDITIKINRPSSNFKLTYNNIEYNVVDNIINDYNHISYVPNRFFYKNNTLKQYLFQAQYLYMIENKFDFFKWERPRLYTNFSYLPSKVRKKFKINGHKLNTKDIKTSFPIFFCDYLSNYDLKEESSFRFINYILNSKDIYKELMKDFNIKKRNNAKILFNSFLNFNNIEKISKNIKLLQDAFPEIWAIINKKNKKNKDKENSIYTEIEKIESLYFFNVFINDLYVNIYDIKILTCHDQIYYENIFEDDVEKIWGENYDKLKNKIRAKFGERYLKLINIRGKGIKKKK